MTALVSTLGTVAISFGDCCKPIVFLDTLGSGMGSLKVTVLFFFCLDTVVLLRMPATFSMLPFPFALSHLFDHVVLTRGPRQL